MKLSVLYGTLAIASAFAAAHPPHPLNWTPPGPNDVRAPCPMLNTLANHGFLPHDGKDITEDDTIQALHSALNIEKELAVYLFQEALTTNPAYNATTFSLNDLSRHGILEHDASLSREDSYFGDDHTFNQAVFDQTRSYWTAPIIDVDAAATARQARVNTSMATNPTYNISQLGEAFSFGETAAYIIVLGDKTEGTVNRSWVEHLFEHERLPLELGWTRQSEALTTSDLEYISQKIMNSTGTTMDGTPTLAKRAGWHGGRKF